MQTSPSRYGRWLLGGAAAFALFHAAPVRAQIQVDVNQRPVSFGNVGPASIGGRVFIPLRAVVEALGADVRWDAATQTVYGSKGGKEFALPIGSRTARVNGRSLDLDAPARLIAGNTMVPLRFVAEALGAEVNWNAVEQRVGINLGGAGGDTPTPGSEEVPQETVSGRLVSVSPSTSPTTLTLRSDTGRQTYRIGPRTQVRRGEAGERGQRANAEDLRPGDEVTVRLDRTGRTAERIDATGPAAAADPRTVSGEVIRVVLDRARRRIVVLVDGAQRTYDVGAARVYHRTGRRDALVAGTLADVVAGDTVEIGLDRTGEAAVRIDATHRRTRPGLPR